MSLKKEIDDTFYAFNDFLNEYRETDNVNKEKLDRVTKALTLLQRTYTNEEIDVKILVAFQKRNKLKKLKADKLPNDVYWHLHDKKFFTLPELASLVGITTEAMRGRVKRGKPVISSQTAVGKRVVSGEEVSPEDIADDSFDTLVQMRNAPNMAVRDRIELEKEIKKRTDEKLNEQTVEKKKQLDDLLNWITDTMIPSVNKANREELRSAGVDSVTVDIRPLIKKALENDIFSR